MDDYADSTLAFIRDRGIAGCDVIGHSFGGRVIVKLAAKDPKTFNRIVLTGAAGVRKHRTLGYYLRVYSFKLGKRLAKRPPAVRLFRLLGVDLEAKVHNAGSEDYRALPESMKRTFSLVVNENLRPLLKKVKNPTLLLWGEEDRETPLWIAKVMEKEIPDCGLVTYPKAGHFAYLECLPQFAAVISNYFGIERGK
jgi:pimeloyl-ACP methyl ester carboxylesterase